MTDVSDKDTDFNPYIVDEIYTEAEDTVHDVEFGNTSQLQNKIIHGVDKWAGAKSLKDDACFVLKTFTWPFILMKTPQGQPYTVQHEIVKNYWIATDGDHFYLQYQPFQTILNQPYSFTQTFVIDEFFAYEVKVSRTHAYNTTDNQDSNFAWIKLAMYLSKEYRNKETAENSKPNDVVVEIPFVYFQKLYEWYMKMKRGKFNRLISSKTKTKFRIHESISLDMFKKKI